MFSKQKLIDLAKQGTTISVGRTRPRSRVYQSIPDCVGLMIHVINANKFQHLKPSTTKTDWASISKSLILFASYQPDTHFNATKSANS